MPLRFVLSTSTNFTNKIKRKKGTLYSKLIWMLVVL